MTISAEYLEALRLCLNFGYINKNYIVDWADKIIMTNLEYDSIILDISLCQNQTARDLDFILKASTTKDNLAYSSRIILSKLNSKLAEGEIDEKHAAQTLYNISLSIVQPVKDKEISYILDNIYYSAEAGINGDLKQVKYKVRRFLSIFSVYSLDNYSDWKNIHSQVDKMIQEFGYAIYE